MNDLQNENEYVYNEINEHATRCAKHSDMESKSICSTER